MIYQRPPSPSSSTTRATGRYFRLNGRKQMRNGDASPEAVSSSRYHRPSLGDGEVAFLGNAGSTNFDAMIIPSPLSSPEKLQTGRKTRRRWPNTGIEEAPMWQTYEPPVADRRIDYNYTDCSSMSNYSYASTDEDEAGPPRRYSTYYGTPSSVVSTRRHSMVRPLPSRMKSTSPAGLSTGGVPTIGGGLSPPGLSAATMSGGSPLVASPLSSPTGVCSSGASNKTAGSPNGGAAAPQARPRHSLLHRYSDWSNPTTPRSCSDQTNAVTPVAPAVCLCSAVAVAGTRGRRLTPDLVLSRSAAAEFARIGDAAKATIYRQADDSPTPDVRTSEDDLSSVADSSRCYCSGTDAAPTTTPVWDTGYTTVKPPSRQRICINFERDDEPNFRTSSYHKTFTRVDENTKNETGGRLWAGRPQPSSYSTGVFNRIIRRGFSVSTISGPPIFACEEHDSASEKASRVVDGPTTDCGSQTSGDAQPCKCSESPPSFRRWEIERVEDWPPTNWKKYMPRSRRPPQAAYPSRSQKNSGSRPLMLRDICPEFTLEEVAQATSNFSQSNRLGEGANGQVYLGVLTSGTKVAVKVMTSPQSPSSSSCPASGGGGFEEEIRVLSMFRHPNLVTLLGYVNDERPDIRILIYEYLARGDLCRLIHDLQSGVATLGWRTRLSAALDAAQGLSYLHSMVPKVFHRDIKTANILLDARGVAKLSDFGLAAYAPRSNPSKLTVKKAEGTPGYADPKYMESLEVTEATEMYSFGMVLLELLTSRSPAVYTSSREGGHRTLRYFLDLIDPNDPLSVLPYVDRGCGWPSEIEYKLSCLALSCIHSNASCRPKCTVVVQALIEMQDWAEQCRPQSCNEPPAPSPGSRRISRCCNKRRRSPKDEIRTENNPDHLARR